MFFSEEGSLTDPTPTEPTDGIGQTAILLVFLALTLSLVSFFVASFLRFHYKKRELYKTHILRRQMLAAARQERVRQSVAAPLPQVGPPADQGLTNRVGPGTDLTTACMLRNCHMPRRMAMMPYHKADVWSVVKEGLAEMASRGARRACQDEEHQHPEAFGQIAAHDGRMPSGATSNQCHLKTKILLGKAPQR